MSVQAAEVEQAGVGTLAPAYAGLVDAARYLGISLSTLRRTIEAGDLKTYRLRGRVLIKYADLDDLIRPATPAEAPAG